MSTAAVRIVFAAIALVAGAVLVFHFGFASEKGPVRAELTLEPEADGAGGDPPRLPLSDNTETILLRLKLPQGPEIGRHRVEISAGGGRVWESGSTLPEGQREIEVRLPAGRLGEGVHELVVVRERKRREDAAVARYRFVPKNK